MYGYQLDNGAWPYSEQFYDSSGNLLTSTRDGISTSFTYDILGNVATVTMPRGLAHVGFALLPFNVPLGTSEAILSRVPLHIVNAPRHVSVIQGRNTVQVDSINVS